MTSRGPEGAPVTATVACSAAHGRPMPQPATRSTIALLLLGLARRVARFPEGLPLARGEPGRPKLLRAPDRRDDLLVTLVFSGGGTRAAAPQPAR